MDWECDAYFAKGAAHTVCEDYAIAKFIGVDPIGVLSDGCSSSDNTDIGARILCQSYNNSIHYCEAITRLLNLHHSCLDATLLKMNKNCIDIHGDGFGVFIQTDGTIHCYKVSLESGAPDYLSYNLNEKRKENYHNEFPGKKKLEWYTFKYGESEFSLESVNQSSIFEPITLMKSLECEMMLIFSDGIETFKNKKTLEPIPWQSVLLEMVNFKSVKGKFVQRRMKRYLKECEKNDIVHDDDVSMAAIYFGN